MKTRLIDTPFVDALCRLWLWSAFAVMICFHAFDRIWESALRFARGLRPAAKDRLAEEL